MTILTKLQIDMIRSKISGLGFFVPENVVSNEDLSKLMDTLNDWISERTGIKNRRWVDDKKHNISHGYICS